MAKSVEEQVENYFKELLNKLGVRTYGKTESINTEIGVALDKAVSKSGGNGSNRPDIQLLLDDGRGRRIPVMIEAKGSKNKLERLNTKGEIELVKPYPSDSREGATNPHKKGDPNYTSIQNYAVNGALHYGEAIIDGAATYPEVIIVGINGTKLVEGKIADPEAKAYYVSKANNQYPKEIKQLADENKWSLFKPSNISQLFTIIDDLNLTEEERERLTAATEEQLESVVKKIHQKLYDDDTIKNLFSTNEKLYIFTGLIMAGLSNDTVKGLEISDFKGLTTANKNDGQVVIEQIEDFLNSKRATQQKMNMVMGLLRPIFDKRSLWEPKNGESLLKRLYSDIKDAVLPHLESDLQLDFTGRILNSLNDWVQIENDRANDVVLTPRQVTKLMAQLTRTNKDSRVWDWAMGSGGFLTSALDLMLKDARQSITDKQELAEKEQHIKQHQILGIEILGNIFLLSVLNMILMGDGSSNLIYGDAHHEGPLQNFDADVFLLNPPYSAEGKGFNFVEEALAKMERGYGAVIIQENAGSGQGLPYTKNILKRNRLVASIHMPSKLFTGKSSVQTAIYVFEINHPHQEDDLVSFIDFSEDGYARQNRKKSTQAVNLRNVDHAQERYREVVAIVNGKRPKTSYYTETNGKLIRDTISLNGDDWAYNQHLVIDTTPTEEDFKKTVADYLAWKVSTILKGEVNSNE